MTGHLIRELMGLVKFSGDYGPSTILDQRLPRTVSGDAPPGRTLVILTDWKIVVMPRRTTFRRLQRETLTETCSRDLQKPAVQPQAIHALGG